MSGSRISFATIDLSVNAARRKLRTKADPRSPARQLTPQEIIEHIPEGDDGMLWGAYEIPIYLDPPLDRSNRETADSEMADEYESHDAVRTDDGVIIFRVFDATDRDGMDVKYADVDDLPKTEAYHKVFSIAERLSENVALNDEDFAEKEDAYAVEALALQARDAVWKDHVPEDWANFLQGWLVSRGIEYDRAEKTYAPGSVLEGMRVLGFLKPEVMKEFLSPDERASVEAVEKAIAVADEQFAEYFRARPNLAPRRQELEAVHRKGLEGLNALYVRLLRQEQEPDVPNPEQFEMDKVLRKIDPSAKARNKEILKRIEEEKDNYVAYLKGILDEAASRAASEPSEEDEQEELDFA